MTSHRNIEYSFWANEQTIGSASLLLLGGIIGVIPFPGFNSDYVTYEFYWASILAIIVSVLTLIIEYPRGKRKKGSTVERKFQQPLAKFITLFGPLTRNYFARATYYFLLAVPCCCLITTFLGGVGMIIGSLIYFVSAVKGEEWKLPSSEAGESNRNYLEAPKNPPPRRPPAPSSSPE